MKHNYDLVISDIINKNEWVCPYCKNICFCSKCIRDDFIVRIKKNIVDLGGECQYSYEIPEIYIPEWDVLALSKKVSKLDFKMLKRMKSGVNDLEDLKKFLVLIEKREKIKYELYPLTNQPEPYLPDISYIIPKKKSLKYKEQIKIWKISSKFHNLSKINKRRIYVEEQRKLLERVKDTITPKNDLSAHNPNEPDDIPKKRKLRLETKSLLENQGRKQLEFFLEHLNSSNKKRKLA